MTEQQKEKTLRKLEDKILHQVENPVSEAEIEGLERELKEGPEAHEGLGIEEEEKAGQEPNIVIEKIVKEEEEE